MLASLASVRPKRGRVACLGAPMACPRFPKRLMEHVTKVANMAEELDPAGVPKLPLTVLEALALDACNLVKAWAESDRRAPFPEEAHMKVDAVLMMAAQRRKGVQ